MTKIRTLQLYRGTTAQNNAYTGSAGELTMDTTTNELRLHDGSTVGGHIIGSGGSSGGYHPDLFDCKWADHICNDVQWLRADTFSWQSGAVYQAAYQHLADDITGKTLQSETIGSTTVQFYLADDGHKICPASQESNVTAIYNATGVAWYYILDTVNQRFKLPRRHSQQIVRSVENADGSWYRLYADGWVEQGCNSGQTGTITLPVVMADSNYFISTRVYNGTNNVGWGEYGSDIARTTTTFRVGSLPSIWEVKGMAAIDMSSFQGGEKYLYFYVGNFTQTALENTAGLNAELFNGKADVSTVAHVVTEFQEPTAANNYTWYRKYADGWVEQGGRHTPSSSSDIGHASNQINLLVAMYDTNYNILTAQVAPSGGTGYYDHPSLARRTSTTTISICFFGQVANDTTIQWQVSGMAA
jgi:hypothetical protein